MAEKDYYRVLGVEKNATKDQIKAAYKRLAKQHHPDLNKDAGSSEKFKEINEAASILGDDEKRKKYDQFGSDAFKYAGNGSPGPGDFSGFDFSDFGFDFEGIFDNIFSSGFSGTRGFSGSHRSNRGQDLAYELTLTLKEAAEGIKKKIKVTKNDFCEACSGRGGTGEDTCHACKGTGSYRETRRTPFGLFQTTTSCRNCNGTGIVFKNICKECEGAGRLRTTKTLEVNIPAGIVDNARLRVNGEGEAGFRGSQNGDLYLIIHVEPHEVFEREDDDLLMDLKINFVQAALGAKVKVPTIKGEATLKIPEGTQPGTILRMKGEGIKRMNSFGKGDQLVRIIVEIPQSLTKKQEKLLKDFNDTLD